MTYFFIVTWYFYVCCVWNVYAYHHSICARACVCVCERERERERERWPVYAYLVSMCVILPCICLPCVHVCGHSCYHFRLIHLAGIEKLYLIVCLWEKGHSLLGSLANNSLGLLRTSHDEIAKLGCSSFLSQVCFYFLELLLFIFYTLLSNLAFLAFQFFQL